MLESSGHEGRRRFDAPEPKPFELLLNARIEHVYHQSACPLFEGAAQGTLQECVNHRRGISRAIAQVADGRLVRCTMFRLPEKENDVAAQTLAFVITQHLVLL